MYIVYPVEYPGITCITCINKEAMIMLNTPRYCSYNNLPSRILIEKCLKVIRWSLAQHPFARGMVPSVEA